MASTIRGCVESWSVAAICAWIVLGTSPAVAGERRMERLGRGVVAVRTLAGDAFVSWRFLPADPDDVAFHVYRVGPGGSPQRRTDQALAAATCFLDRGGARIGAASWFVRPVASGRELEPSPPCTLPAMPPSTLPAMPPSTLPAMPPAGAWIEIPLRTPEGCTPNDASVGDLDGDGEYEIVLKQEESPRDNSQRGTTGRTRLEAYDLDGTFLWRIDLGRNTREGAHYTPFIVYDLDGDGRAEVAVRTADGSIDGAGKAIGDPALDHRNAAGYVLEGKEYLTVFDGRTGAALATADYVPTRGVVSAWGDDYGNRVDRFLACVAYVDGENPSLVFCRGYYTRAVLSAWNWRDGKLSRVWTFDSDDGSPGNRDYRGQGNHNLAAGDIDGDGKDEIVYGACAIDHDGTGLYSTGLGHGDALHLTDVDPDRPGLEVVGIHEKPRHPHGLEVHDARTGKVLWSRSASDVGRGLTADIDPRSRGAEVWAAGAGLDALYGSRGEKVSDTKPRSCNFAVWWDGDLLRELLDGNCISKWDWVASVETRLLVAEGCASGNGSKATPALCADIVGDWREEVVWRTTDKRALRIHVTTCPTPHRLRAPMLDPVYRLSVASQNAGYNQAPQAGFFIGEGMAPAPRGPR